jgi:hypothetical protein
MLSILYDISFFFLRVLLFLFVYNRLSNLSLIRWLSPSLVTGLQTKAYADHLLLLAVKALLRATPAAIQDFGLYGLIRRTGPHVLHMDSNPRRKDHQIVALTTSLVTCRCSNHRATLATCYSTIQRF